MKKIALCLVLLLSACVEVDDFGTTWEKGVVDPCVSAIAKEIYIDDPYKEKADELAKTLNFAPYHFLMLKKAPSDKGGSLMRYDVKDGQYITYVLRDSKRAEFQKKYPDSGVIFEEETATLPLLDEKALKLVQEIAADASYWEETDREPYNPNKNPACTL